MRPRSPEILRIPSREHGGSTKDACRRHLPGRQPRACRQHLPRGGPGTVARCRLCGGGEWPCARHDAGQTRRARRSRYRRRPDAVGSPGEHRAAYLSLPDAQARDIEGAAASLDIRIGRDGGQRQAGECLRRDVRRTRGLELPGRTCFAHHRHQDGEGAAAAQHQGRQSRGGHDTPNSSPRRQQRDASSIFRPQFRRGPCWRLADRTFSSSSEATAAS